ncbi:MAG: hypothetical protein ACI9QQ_002473 [Myxococcota bacterium]
MSIRHRRRDIVERNRTAILVAIVVLVLIAVLSPGKRPWDNFMRWRDPGPGLHFGAIAQALSEEPITTTTGELTLEVWLVPGFVPGIGNQEMISFYDGEGIRPLLIGQFSSGYILRGRADNPTGDVRLDKYIGANEVGPIAPNSISHLAVTVDLEGAALHVNGRKTSLLLKETAAWKGDAFGGHLMLGSSNTGWRLWQGGMLGVAVYDQVLDATQLRKHAENPDVIRDKEFAGDPSLLAFYPFDEGEGDRAHNRAARGSDLTFPDRMTQPTRDNFLSAYPVHPGDRLWIPLDIVSNVLGFAPLGFVLAWKRRTAGIAMALAFGFAFSLSIEIIQPLIPGRNSSIVDLASNSAGALLGALISRIGGSR